VAEAELLDVCKTFSAGVRAVDHLTLHIADGELLVLVGPSGSGKTTTLRLLAGLEHPTSGAIKIAGRDVTRVPPHRRDVGFVFQRPALYPHLNVRQNLLFGHDLRTNRWHDRLRRLFRTAPSEELEEVEKRQLDVRVLGQPAVITVWRKPG